MPDEYLKENTRDNAAYGRLSFAWEAEMKINKRIEERFHQYYQRGRYGECWEWQMSVNRNGYGRFKVGASVERAHRVSYALHKGSIPDGMLVCHRCDNPSCVNPDHLFLGTPLDNMQDMVKKGRQVIADHSGERNARAELTESDVKDIINLISLGLSNKAIAERYSVTHSSISNIRRGKTWTNLRRPHEHPCFKPYGSLNAADRAAF